MDQDTLVMDEIDAGEDLARRLDRFVPVDAAFWIKDSEERHWYLFLASSRIDDRNLDVAYGEVLRIAGEMANPHLDPFQVKLIPSSDPLARAAMEIHRRYPGPIASRFGGKTFGGMGVDGVYVYPANLTTQVP